MHCRAATLAAALAFVVLAACGSSLESNATADTGTVHWEPCGNVQCASLSVPLDHDNPQGEQVQLALARRPADKKSKGVLFANPGGPGGSGVTFVKGAPGILRPELLDAFDIVSWDPRGVGASRPVECLDNLDAFYAVDRSPDDAAEVQANVDVAKDFVAQCEARSGSLLDHMSTADSARDMEAIRAAMGVEQVNYIGFSYGTLLGALYADRFPTRVRAMVLDGAVDPSVSAPDATVQQSKGFDEQLQEFFAWCRDTPDCGFATGGDPESAYTRLQTAVAAEATPATVDGEERTLTAGEFDIGVASALYGGEANFDNLADALAETGRGLGDKMLAFADQYTERETGGKYSNQTAAMYATTCVDTPGPKNLDEVEALAAEAEQAAPHFGATTAWLGLPCAYWPVKASGKVAPVRAAGAPPLLVVGTTKDPATPYVWAQGLANQLERGHLLTRDGEGHTGYGKGNDCIDEAVDAYLRDLTVPPEGTICT
jgi:pimeloyl-ACP methyl ester carboxylesterase